MATTVTLPVGRDNRGFTLIELVLVLVVLGISMAIVVPNIGRRLQEREVRSSALGLAAVARDLRSRALLDGTAQQLVVSMAHNTYLVPKKREIHLPQDVRIVSIAGGEAVERPVEFGEVFATLYHSLGIDVNKTTVTDLTGRPQFLVDHGLQPMRELVG